MKIAKAFLFVLVTFLFCTHPMVAQAKQAPPPLPHTTQVDIALLLDTSNSMDGLINQAKSQLWTIVQEFAEAEKDGSNPVLRVALFEYGNTNLPAREGYLRQVVPLSENLDILSEALFALSTDGGDEYCGEVIQEAVTRLDWASQANSYQAIFIAGNEPFNQGSVDYNDSCLRAHDQGIVINTIHCGNYQEGVKGEWDHGASIGQGEFLNIDQDQKMVHIPCPQDDDILYTNEKLNQTYLWYGTLDSRLYNCNNQSKQDSNAESLSPSVAIKRFKAKVGSAYSNSGRDLVDSYESNPDILKEVKEDELPDVMQEMTKAERAQHLQEQSEARKDLQNQIKTLVAERENYYQAELKKMNENKGTSNLGDAVVMAIRKQLQEAGFQVASDPKSNEVH